MRNATFANPTETEAIVSFEDGRTPELVPLGHPLLEGLTVAPYAVPAKRVESVLPVAFRRAARATPMPGQPGVSVMDAILAGAAEDPEKADAIEYAVRMERADLVAGGMPEALVDQVLALAATYPGSGAVMGLVP